MSTTVLEALQNAKINFETLKNTKKKSLLQKNYGRNYVSEILSCPFCRGNNTQIRTQDYWTGMRSTVISATVIHWCNEIPGQPRSVIQIKGKTTEDAVNRWNKRA